MSTSVNSTINNDLRIIDYDIITKALIYKKLNPPHYRVYNFNKFSYMGSVLSRSVSLIYNVQGIGTFHQFFVYDIKNNIVKYRHLYISEKEREKNRKQNKKKRLGNRMKINN